MWTTAFWRGAAERAAKSAAQALLLLWVGDGAFDVWTVDWRLAGGVAAGAVLLSLLTSATSAGTGPAGSPSLVDDRPAGG